MIIPGKQDLIIRKGQDFSFPFTVEIDAVEVVFTGSNVLAQIRESQNRSSTKIVDFTDTLSGNEITLSLTDTQTSAITQSQGFYDVLVITAGGTDDYYLEGKITFADTVTVKP